MHHSWVHFFFGTYEGFNTNGDNKATIIVDAPEQDRITIECNIFSLGITNNFTTAELNRAFNNREVIGEQKFRVTIDKGFVEYEKTRVRFFGKSKQRTYFHYELIFHEDRLYTVFFSKYIKTKKSAPVYELNISNVNRIK